MPNEGLFTLAGTLLGALGTGFGSYFVTKATKAMDWRTARFEAELKKREDLYSEFLAEATKLLMRAVHDRTANSNDFAVLSHQVARIRLVASEKVSDSARTLFQSVLYSFGDDEARKEKKEEPSKFIGSCREELEALKAAFRP